LEIAENEKYEENEFPYRKIIGSLMYAMLGTRPDLATQFSCQQILENQNQVTLK
jgi:hypothetical protein